MLVAFLGVAIWESYAAARKLAVPTERRWRNHALVYAVSTFFSMAVLRTSPILLALSLQSSRFGLLNRTWMPVPVRWVLGVLLLDLGMYLQHRASHAVEILWRLHQVHHSDPDVDLSTGIRVHPLHMLFTQGAYLATVALLAPPPGAVLAVELAGVFQIFFSHANAHLPQWLDRILL